MSEKGVRRSIIDAIFDQGGTPFTASSIAGAVGERSAEVHSVIDLMRCVDSRGTAEGVPGRCAILYQVTKTPPVPCVKCHFNAPRISSCSRAPNHSDAAGTEEPMRAQRWKSYLQACDEAQTGYLTDVDGKRIPPAGYLDGSQ